MNQKRNKKILLIGGHLTPALAVLDELKERDFNNIVWVGRRYAQVGDRRKSSEYKLIRKKGIKFYDLKTGRLQRKWVGKTFWIGIKQLLRIPLGFYQSFSIVLKEKPDIIVSFGGYLAVPVVIASKLLFKKVVTHEQTITSGLANKIIGRLANKVFISWEESRKFFPKRKTVKTGNPIRKSVLRVDTNEFNFDNDLPIIYVTGASQGSNTINWRLLEILPKLLKRTNIIHQTGSSSVTNDHTKALKAKKRLPKKLKNNYVVKKHIFSSEIGEVFHKSIFIVSRSGANTVTEILALGKPAILIPIPWTSGDEQTKNARFLERVGLADVIIQDELTPELLHDRIILMLDKIEEGKNLNGVSWEAIKKSAKVKTNLDAAKLIVDELEKLL